MKKNFLIALRVFLVLTIITGIIYPLVITLFANVIYPGKSKGSMIYKDNKIIGSELIGQKFTSPEYFWGRPSAIDNNPMPSGGSNLGPTSRKLKNEVQARIDMIKKYHENIPIQQIPKDLLFASASGVDPDISPEAAYFQIDRIAKARKMNMQQKKELYRLLSEYTRRPQYELFGMPRVNVFLLNLVINNIK
ncbi:MAG: potassium-transporting ATPase subunit KdpC [Bacteroidetes bacterium]|nr:MAG: potassium-transporting ATPase subunit KdpC [Bacteroidota bacterium]